LARASFLSIGNPRKVIEQLRPLLTAQELQKIEDAANAQVQLLFDLALSHFRFSERLANAHWRQRISRYYYAAYSASKCVRLFVQGEHSKEVADHKKVGAVPNDFPDRALYEAQLAVLREDRNSCDYDHEFSVGELVISQREASELVRKFLIDTKVYVGGRGLALAGKV